VLLMKPLTGCQNVDMDKRDNDDNDDGALKRLDFIS
jgi:hypothetical protein